MLDQAGENRNYSAERQLIRGKEVFPLSDGRKTRAEEMPGGNPKEAGTFDEAFKIFKLLNPDFQTYALGEIKRLLELQDELTSPSRD